MAFDKDKIVIRDEQGIEKTFYKLLQFSSTETHKRYLVYTDYSKNEDGSLHLFSSIIIEKDGMIEFIPIQDERDQEIVNQAIIQVKLSFMENK